MNQQETFSWMVDRISALEAENAALEADKTKLSDRVENLTERLGQRIAENAKLSDLLAMGSRELDRLLDELKAERAIRERAQESAVEIAAERAMVQDLADRAYAKVSALQRERDGLREFAHHDIGCDLVVHDDAACSCGFAALSSPESPAPARYGYCPECAAVTESCPHGGGPAPEGKE